MAEQILNLKLDEAMAPRFMAYAQSVLMDRAIPSGFDGLKPIHRRILVSMHRIGLASNQPYRKSAKTIGVCLAEMSPHGDASAYEAMVGLAQPFNMRYPLVDGSGNFGSPNGDSAAAMRYTEARLSPFGELLLGDVDNLADTKDNFDNSGKEPVNLVGYFPELLCNPCNGIAVGFSTKFAPHYAKDVYNAIILTIDNAINEKETTVDDLIDIIKAPDFPTGAQIINTSELRNIYKTGKGSVILRAKYKTEKDKIIYNEIPYKVSPNSIVSSIAALNISDIKDVRDESSSRNGIRIVVDLKKGANSEWIINKLFKDTPLQSNYNVNMVAIMDNKPVVNLDLKTIIDYYLNNISVVHNKSIVKQLNDINFRLTSVNTMLKAIQHIDEIARIIKGDEDPKNSLCANLQLEESEAEYILNCKLSSLSRASKEDLESKKTKYENESARLNTILSSLQNFLTDLKEKFISIRDSKIFKNDARRTELLDLNINTKSLDIKAYTKKEPVVVTYSNKGMIKATRPDEYKTNRRNAMGVKNKSLREDEFICNMLTLDTHSELLLFSDLGKCYTLPVCKIPINNRNGASKSINNYINLEDDEHILSIIGMSDVESETDNRSVVMVTKFGYIKRIDLKLLTKARSSTVGTKAITLQDNDKIKGVNICEPNSDIIIFTSYGRGLKLNIDDDTKPIRMMGKLARGCSAIKLKDDEVVVNASVIDENRSIVLVTSNGYGKRLDYKAFKDQKRNQTPVIYMSRISKVGNIIDGIMVNHDEDLMITTHQGQTLRLNIDDIKSTSRTAMGLKYINIKAENDHVISITAIKKEKEDEEENNELSD